MASDAATREVQRLFLRHTSLLRGFIIGLLGDLEAGDDVLHEAFLTATAKADEFEPGSDFLAWARAIARFKVLEHLRGRARGPQHLSPDVVELLAADAPAAEAAVPERRSALADCLDQVVGRSRELLELRYVEGLAPRVIARRMEWSVGAVNVGLSRARQFLRECAQRKLASGEN